MTRSDFAAAGTDGTQPPAPPASRWRRWRQRLAAPGSFAWSVLPADLTATGLILAVLLAPRMPAGPGPGSLALLSLAAVLPSLATLAYHPGRGRRELRLLIGTVLAGLILPPLARAAGVTLPWPELVRWLAGGTLSRALLLRWQVRRGNSLEPLRWTLAAAGGAWVAGPFLTPYSLGTGDAQWYATMVGDFVAQWRAGFFPVFAGQSEFAFNGSISPVRLAPYLQHAAGIVDLLTGRGWPPAALLNTVLFGSLVGGAVAAYAALAAGAHRARWIALVLAWLVVQCPGVLAQAYTGDLFMSVCALPYLALAGLGVRRALARPSLRAAVGLASALAALWLCHPPIAFWTSLTATIALLPLVPGLARRPEELFPWAAAAGVFGLLTAGLFVSVGTLGLPPLLAERGFIVQYLASVFPAVLLTVSSGANALSDYQLGWGLWLVLLFAAVAAVMQRRRDILGPLTGAGLLLMLLLPIPGLNAALWGIMPQTVVNLTNHWPMQRFCAIIAVFAVIAAQAPLARFAARRRWVQPVAVVLLLPALGWSTLQAMLFLERAGHITATPAAEALRARADNRVLTRYAFTPFPQMPPYFSHGHIDPVLENRLVARPGLAELDSNRRAVLQAEVVQAGEIMARPLDGLHTSYQGIDGLVLAPGRRYALELRFTDPKLAGALILSGPTLQRDYLLPDSAAGQTLPLPPASFGTLTTSSPVITLEPGSGQPEPLSVLFVASPPLAADPASLGRYTLRAYDPKTLPIPIERWVPYRTSVTAPTDAFVETPRLFLAGYAATVNGRAVDVVRSPGGQVLVPVTAGANRVELVYRGPGALRAAYFLSLAAWVVWLGATVFRPRGRAGSR